MKNYKKVVSAIAALSMVASSLVMPMSASARTPIAEDAIGTTVRNGVATILTNGGIGIVASYDENGRLTAIKTDTLKEEMGLLGDTITFDVAVGDKVMLWDGLDTMKPLADAVTVTEDMMATQPPATETPTPTPEVTETPTPPPTVPDPTPAGDVIASWKFDFGSAEDVAEGYTAVTADQKYDASVGYGFLGLENGFAQDPRDDGWVMTQGYDLVLENGAKDSVASADDDWVATTTRIEKDQDYNSPIRFALRVDPNTYYNVKVKLQRADASKEAKVSLFTEKRHQQLLDAPIPEEGLVHEASVYVHNNWSKNTGEYVDKMLNIVAAGDNVAVSSIEINQIEQGKTLWILSDSTGCQQTASIPYWPLDHCQGIGSAAAKYLAADWALVNEAESGLSASASKNHFNNMQNDIKPGDVVWFQFGHNDDKVTNDPSTNGYLSTLEQYYTTITEKGANLVVVSPVQRCTAGQFANGTWSASLGQYATAGNKYVEDKVAAGATNIAYIDLNDLSLGFLNDVQKEIDEGRAAQGLASLGSATPRFYYYVSKYAGYSADYTHPNDFGADNFASLVVKEAKAKIAAASDDAATASQKAQAAVLDNIFGNAKEIAPVKVAAEVYNDGAAPNSFYPTQLAKVVKYEYPLIVEALTFDENGKPDVLKVKLVASDVTYSYGRGIIDIYTKDGELKGTVKTEDVVDAVSSENQEINFADTEVVFDQAAGDTFVAYVNAVSDLGVDEDRIISTKYTQDDMVDVKEYLLQGSIGTENKEDFSSYNLADGDSIIGTNGWTNPGGETFAFGKEGDLTFAHCVTTGSATYYPEKKFTAVSDGQLMCRFDLRYISGTFNLFFTDGTILNNWPEGRISPIQVKTEGGEVKVYFNGNAVATVNSGEWNTYKLIIDLDYGTYTLSLNGETFTSDFAAYQSNDAILTPSQLAIIAFQNDKSSNEYDITNIVLATLNVPELPERSLTVATANEAEGTVSIKDYEGTSVSVPMNTVVTAVAEAADGYAFKAWEDADGNVVSYSAEYQLRLHNNVDVTAVFEEAVYDPITYSYKEDFSTLATSTLAANDWKSTNAQGSLTVESDADHGNYLQFAPGQANSRGMQTNFATGLTADYILEADIALKAGNNQETVFAITNAAQNNAINDGANNYVFSLMAGANATAWTINGGTETVELPSGGWVHLKLTVGSTDEVGVEITNGDAVLYSGTATALGGIDLKGIHLRSGRYQAVTKIDNIRVYTADQVVAE